MSTLAGVPDSSFPQTSRFACVRAVRIYFHACAALGDCRLPTPLDLSYRSLRMRNLACRHCILTAAFPAAYTYPILKKLSLFRRFGIHRRTRFVQQMALAL